MKTKKTDNVLREIRRVRNKHYEETKNMSIAERMEYYRKNSESFRKELTNFKPDYDRFPFIHRKETNNDQNNTD